MKIAVVTGTSYGLGNNIVKSLLFEGYKVYGISRTKTKIANKNFVWLKCDLLSFEDIGSIAHQICEDKIDLLVNNAGVVFPQKGLDFTEDIFSKTYRINLIAPILLVNALKNKLDGCLVINISSTSDRFAENSLGMYCSSKAALSIYFDAVALENPNMKFINILPVYVDTPMLTDISKKLNFSVENANSPEKVSEAVLSVINDNNKFESGVRVMILTNENVASETKDPEKLWYYNLDTNEFKKVK